MSDEDRLNIARARAHETISELERAAALAEREACFADLATFAAQYNSAPTRIVLGHAMRAIREGQAKRAGACGKVQDCGGGCSLPVGHAPPCSCAGHGEECHA